MLAGFPCKILKSKKLYYCLSLFSWLSESNVYKENNNEE